MTIDFYKLAEPYLAEIKSCEFVQKLVSGELPVKIFQEYLSQDALYLRKEADHFRQLSNLAKSKKERLFFEEMRQDCLQIETEMQEKFFSSFGVASSKIELPNFLIYRMFLETQLKIESYEVAITAFLPCYLLYAELGKFLVAESVGSNKYQDFISTYSGEPYAEYISRFVQIIDKNWQKTDAVVRKKMELSFLMACQHEVNIFQYFSS